jgi:hypothetical protein
MNWRLLTGVFFILGGLKIFFAQTNAYMAGAVKAYPVAAQSGSAVLILVGIFLIYKGRKGNPSQPKDRN